jgi:hypothetical protein
MAPAEATSGHSRRALLIASAIGAGVAWTAPMMTSMPAFAASTCTGGSAPCTKFYQRKITGGTVSGSSCTATGTVEVGDGSCPQPTVAQLCVGVTGTPVFNAEPLPAGATVSGCHSGDVAIVTLPVGAVPLGMQLKPGAACSLYRWDGSTFTFVSGSAPAGCVFTFTVTPPSGSTGYKIVATDNGTCTNDISHFNVYFCI